MSLRYNLVFFIVLISSLFMACNEQESLPNLPPEETVNGPFSAWMTQEDSLELISRLEKTLKKLSTELDTNFDSYQSLSRMEVVEFYKERNYQPLWSYSLLTQHIFDSIQEIDRLALRSGNYAFSSLSKEMRDWQKSPANLKEVAQWEINLTERLLLVSNHLYYGKLSPIQFHWSWNINRGERDEPSYKCLKEAVENNSFNQFLKKSFLNKREMKDMLSSFALYKDSLKWGIDEELHFYDTAQRKLEPLKVDSIVPALKRRMFAENYADSSIFLDTTLEYNKHLVESVKRYQVAHGLNADGVIGKRTIASINKSKKERLAQLELNIERYKWFGANIEGDYIWVNVPYFRLYASLGDSLWKTKVVVGKLSTRTPMFKAKMKYVVFNPTWTLPYSIASLETLPKLKKDSTYLQENNMILLDDNREEVSSEGIDWSQFTDKNFPYTIRQGPGDDNSLGRIKFLFPNDHYIYLHDTPSKNLFRTDGRSYSHGCIRVQDPKELARKILNDTLYWSMDTIQATLDSMETVTIRLENRFPVYIVYLTAYVDDNGRAMFFNDVYGYDEAVLQELENYAIKED